MDSKTTAPAIELEVADVPNPHPLNGLSVEWDPHLFRRWNTGPDVPGRFDPAADWPLFCRRIRGMGLHRARMMMQPEWFASAPGVYDFSDGNEAVDAVCRQLDLAQETGMHIDLTIWCARSDGFMGYPQSPDWCSAPTDPDVYVQIAVEIVKEFLVRRGYTCIGELTLFNEPSWAAYAADGAAHFFDYAVIARKANDLLVREGLRDRIRLVIADDAEHDAFYRQSVDELHDIADLYAGHTYAYGMETPNAVIAAYVAERVAYARDRGSGKPFIIDEMATNKVIPPMKATDSYDYTRGLFLAKLTVTALSAGAAGVSYWCLYDENYDDGLRMEVGSWGMADEGYTVRPTYHAWGLLTARTAVGSAVYPVRSDRPEEVSAVALKAPDGRVSYVVLDLTDVPCPFRLRSAPVREGVFRRYLFSEPTLPADDRLPAHDRTCPVCDGVLADELPAMSFAVYVEER